MAMRELFKNKKLLLRWVKYGKKQEASAHMKAGWWELEREGNVRAGGRHRECVLY